MKQITDIQELRKLQMDILDNIHQFCEERNITYFLSCGSLIGAVRHKGYIPWDDDIDLYMPRSSYERFVDEYNDPTGKYELLEPRKTKKYFYTFAKVSDTRTLMVEAWYDNFPIGVNIDVFPVDYVTEDMKTRKRLFWLKKNLFRIYIDKRVRLFRDRKPWHVFKRLICKLIPVPSAVINGWLRNIAYYKTATHTVCNMTEVGPSMKGCFNASCIASAVDIEFEGKIYKTMCGYKEYLEHTYGDYMTLPPEDQRQTHKFEAYYK